MADDLAPYLTPARAPDHAEVVVIGGGPAGAAACVWCARLGRPAVVLEPGLPGGQLHQIHFEIPDLPGQAPIAGADLARRLTTQMMGSATWVQTAARSIDPETLRVTLDEGHLDADGIILATGLRRRALGVPGEQRLRGLGLIATASRDVDHLAGETVVVVGGGDGAYENALKLVKLGARVVVVARGAPRARDDFVAAVEAHPDIETRRGRVEAFEGQTRLEAVRLADGQRIAARAALVRVGWMPNNEYLPAAWLGADGRPRVDASLRIAPRVYAIGDLRAPTNPSLSTAYGDAANAAKALVRALAAAGE